MENQLSANQSLAMNKDLEAQLQQALNSQKITEMDKYPQNAAKYIYSHDGRAEEEVRQLATREISVSSPSHPASTR